MIHRELEVGDDVQSHIGGPSRKMERWQFNDLSSAEIVYGDSSVGTRSERHEVGPQHDFD
jgi:hypothetical protein